MKERNGEKENGGADGERGGGRRDEGSRRGERGGKYMMIVTMSRGLVFHLKRSCFLEVWIAN